MNTPKTSGEPGSPSATTIISGTQLPPPDPKFGGVIGQKASESKAWWAPRVVPPQGAPNVVLILLDDCGFGAQGTFGVVIPPPRAGSHCGKWAATTEQLVVTTPSSNYQRLAN
jgi:hypothetical protein